jgi:DinB superfamily/Pentapeptide repeats (8 copies)
MSEFTGADLSGSRFEEVDLTGASFRLVDLSGVRIRNAVLTGMSIRGALAGSLEIDGDIENLRVNGVDVAPLVQAELDRRYPDRVRMRPDDADGFRTAWGILERLWSETVSRARGLPPDLLHERVDGEWSFIETLRHLVFATDAWVRRAILGDPAPWDPLDLPCDEVMPVPGLACDRDARPSLERVLELREDRMRTVGSVLAGLTDDQLAGMTEAVTEPGYPEPESFAVRRCLQAILSEEWHHRLFAERDLDVLAGWLSE